MNDIALIRIYGHFRPVGDALYRNVESICRQALPQAPEVAASREGDLLRLAFEGIYFPVPEVLECLEKGLSPNARGRLDVLDIENWRLERHDFTDGRFGRKAAPLNHVLDYSGF